ncbi:MAG: shikimate kinase [Ignavibacteriales bacterium]|nr:MAG: shikimate kinase [Ignavibacteriales bacterium]
MTNSRIYLTGFMGAGKSTIGPILANTLGWNFFDLDRVIEKNEGKKVRDLFEQHGEKYFRDLELDTLNKLTEEEGAVISLGGGTISSEHILTLLKSTGVLIYLKTSPEASYKRLRYKRDRPNLISEREDEPSKDELIGKINNLLESRVRYYEQADYTINTDSFTVGRTVDKIVNLIKNKK